MTEIGAVIERLSDGRARVEIHRGAACDGCHAKGACAPLSRGGIVRFDADDPYGFAPGTSVQVGIAEGGVLKAVWWVYVVPVVLAIACGVGTWYLMLGDGVAGRSRDLVAAAASLGGAVIGFGVLRWVELLVRRSPDSVFRVRIVGPVRLTPQAPTPAAPILPP